LATRSVATTDRNPPIGKSNTERSIPLHPQAAEALQPLIDIARKQRGRRRDDPAADRAVQHLFVVRGKLLSKSLLFDRALAEACTAAGLVDSAGKATITAHRSRHTIGTQLAEGGARIQAIDRRPRRLRPMTFECFRELGGFFKRCPVTAGKW